MNESEKPPLFFDVVFPPTFCEDIKNKGKCDAKKIAEEGMVLVFDSILPKELSTKENFSTIPRQFCDEDGKTIILDVDKYFDEASECSEFLKSTGGKIGNFPLWIFQNTIYVCELYSKKKLKEFEEKGMQSPNRIYANYVKIINDEAEKQGKEHWCIFVSTHEYLLKPFYMDQFLDIHHKHFVKALDKTNETPNKIHKVRDVFTKSIRHEVFKKYMYKCADCGKSNKETILHIDHILPVSQGGTDELDNLQCLCQDCNLAKKSRFFFGGV